MEAPIILEAYETEKFRYMMLSRLQSDCEYFLGWGKFSNTIYLVVSIISCIFVESN
jgi:hypothetical protein